MGQVFEQSDSFYKICQFACTREPTVSLLRKEQASLEFYVETTVSGLDKFGVSPEGFAQFCR